jgi:hypothetical protein
MHNIIKNGYGYGWTMQITRFFHSDLLVFFLI